jgi:hypothetical protein
MTIIPFEDVDDIEKHAKHMWKAIVQVAGKVVGSTTLKDIGKWCSQHPTITAEGISTVIGLIVTWVFTTLDRAPKEDISKLRNILQERFPSITWSTSKPVFIKQITAFAGKGDDQRAAMLSAISEAGFSISLPAPVLSYLSNDAASDHDQELVAHFSSVADAALNRKDQITAFSFDESINRVKLLKEASRVVGGYPNFLVLRDAILALDESDVQRAMATDDVER